MRVKPRTIVAGVLSLVAGGLLIVAFLAFVLTNFCEDACDKPDWTFWSATQNALPFAVGALLAMAAATFLFMAGDDTGRPRWARAATIAGLSSAALVGAVLVLLAVLSALRATKGAGPFIVGVLVLIPLWAGLTAAVARRSGSTD